MSRIIVVLADQFIETHRFLRISNDDDLTLMSKIYVHNLPFLFRQALY